MKALLALMLLAPSAFAATSVNNYDCYGQTYDQLGNKLGYGSTLVVLLNDNSLRLRNQDTNRTVELFLDDSGSSAPTAIYRTEDSRFGLGLGIYNRDIGINWGAPVSLYLFGIRDGVADAPSFLDCRVSSSGMP